MKNILLVLSSPRGWKSHSHQFASHIVDDLKARHPGAKVVVRRRGERTPAACRRSVGTGRVLPLEKTQPGGSESPRVIGCAGGRARRSRCRCARGSHVQLRTALQPESVDRPYRASRAHLFLQRERPRRPAQGQKGRRRGRPRRRLFRRPAQNSISRSPTFARSSDSSGSPTHTSCASKAWRWAKSPQERDGVRKAAIERSGARVRVIQDSKRRSAMSMRNFLRAGCTWRRFLLLPAL